MMTANEIDELIIHGSFSLINKITLHLGWLQASMLTKEAPHTTTQKHNEELFVCA